MKRSQPNSPSYNLDNIQKRRKSSHNEQLTTLKSYFQDLIAHRNRDPALVRRAELWTEVVDKFSEFVQLLSSACRESDDTIDFKLVGSALECATEFYAAELDALSNDVYKLTSMLQRGERSCRRESVEMPSIAQHVQPQSVQTKKTVPQQRRHVIKRIKTVVDPKQLDQKLQTNAMLSPIFQKLNSQVGDMCNASRMLRNNLPPSHLSLHVDKPFWSQQDEIPAQRSAADNKLLVALPLKMFENFNSLRIRREIDYTKLSNRREAVTLDEEDLDTEDELGSADSCLTQSDDDNFAMDDGGAGAISENDVDENLNSISRCLNDDDDSKHGNINEIADLVGTGDVDEDEEKKINPNNLLSAHENLQLLSSSLIDLVTTTGKKHPQWRESNEKKKKKLITLHDILVDIDESSFLIIGGIDDTRSNSSQESLTDPRRWKREALKLKPRLELSASALFDTFASSSCEVDEIDAVFTSEDVMLEVVEDEVMIDSGIVADATQFDVDFRQQNDQLTAADDFSNFQPSNFLATSTPLQAARKSMKRIENETLKRVNRVKGEPVKFSQLYNDVSQSLQGETSCALTFFSVLKAASSGEGDRVKVQISRGKDESMDDFWIQSLHAKSKRKMTFSSVGNDDNSSSFNVKKSKLDNQ